MRFDLLTIFPGYFASPLSEALVGKAIDDGLLDVRVVDLRLFSDDPHRKVDDEAYGGGPGMVLAAPPLFAAIEALRDEEGAAAPHVVYLSPRGRRLDAGFARELASRPRLVLVCGRYEGIDERVREAGLFDEEVSLGDFVLPGGEAAALALLEAVSRFVPGVVGEADSVRLDSFEDGLLDHPHYTRPREFRGLAAPEELLSGHHERIRRWRRERQFEQTARYRPDLLDRFAPATEEDRELLARVAPAGRTP
jgi:tRNA (guanine37-N1)-methyltransferase